MLNQALFHFILQKIAKQGRVQHFSLNTTLKFMNLRCWMKIVRHNLQTKVENI